MNPRLAKLNPYPFERLRALTGGGAAEMVGNGPAPSEASSSCCCCSMSLLSVCCAVSWDCRNCRCNCAVCSCSRWKTLRPSCVSCSAWARAELFGGRCDSDTLTILGVNGADGGGTVVGGSLAGKETFGRSALHDPATVPQLGGEVTGDRLAFGFT